MKAARPRDEESGGPEPEVDNDEDDGEDPAGGNLVPAEAAGDGPEATATVPPSSGDFSPSAPPTDAEDDEESEVLYGGHAKEFAEMFCSISGYQHGDVVRAMREGT